MTWRDFKYAVEKQGVVDDTDIEYIDIGAGLNEAVIVEVEDNSAKISSF